MASFEIEADGQMFLLPPPAEFDEPLPPTSRETSGNDVVLPPPQSFNCSENKMAENESNNAACKTAEDDGEGEVSG